MASAVLANQNEPNWPQHRSGGAKFMGKAPFSKPNPNPKSNPSSKKRQFHVAAGDFNSCQIDESPAVTQTASDDASSINRRPSDFNSGGYLNLNIASYSKKELIELRERLVSELEQIRQLKSRIESHDFPARSSSNLPLKKSAGKKMSGNKRPFPANFSKDVKRPSQDHGSLMKMCGQILTKLMKQKHGHIFNSPVDVVGLGLHDYYDVIKNPMDLGTVKAKMTKNLYDSPLDFAADVRLTFDNAMLYNPKGHEVNILAEQFLGKFEELFRPVNEKLREEGRHEPVYNEELRASSWIYNQEEKGNYNHEERVKKERGNSLPISSKTEQIRAPPSGSNPKPKPSPSPKPNPQPVQLPVRTPSPMRVPPVKPLKQPKPKAKDPHKREMSLEEKHKLGNGLQSLPQEKMEQVVQIIKKRNGHLRQDGDEIELDIEAVDTETLWELDRFVTNYKKMVSKIKRQALMGNNVAATGSNRELPVSEKTGVVNEAKKTKRGEVAEEDVDIGDEMPMSSFPPVEIEKDNGHASSSSSSSGSSSSDSSSSSESDSGSSSGSDSDADAQS